MAAASFWKEKTDTVRNPLQIHLTNSTEDFNDLNPTITYRHLHSHNLGSRDPLRVIALCDSDAFYAACERVRLGLPDDAPVVVQQWESLIAVGYPARKYGISRMDNITAARKKFPEVISVHVATYKEGEKEPGYWEKPDSRTHKVSLDLYRRESAKVMNVFTEGLPDGEIEKASIDEAFIDFTQPVRNAILQRFPHLQSVPPDAPHGLDSPLPSPPPITWTDGMGALIPINPKLETPGLAQGDAQDEDEWYEDVDPPATWHDVALSIAAEMMATIRTSVKERLGYTTSAGIARNKFLAKLSASYKKPNSQSILRNAAIPNYLMPMRFQKIRFLGGKLGKALAEEYESSTVGELLTISLEEMQRKFGEESLWVYEILRGIDRSEVKAKAVLMKSMLASKNLQKPVTRVQDGPHWIRVLAAELALRLRDSREASPGLWPKTIVLHIRQGYDAMRSKQAAFPFVRDASIDIIASAGNKLWKELVGVSDPKAPPLKITNLMLAFTNISALETGQRHIEGFFSAAKTLASDVGRGTSPSGRKRRKVDCEDGFEDDLPRLTDATACQSPLNGTTDEEESDQGTVSNVSFVCEKCSKPISLPAELCGPDIPKDVIADGLIALRSEHADYHLALDLSRGETFKVSASINTSRVKPPPSGGGAASAKKRKGPPLKESEGIAKFFVQKKT